MRISDMLIFTVKNVVNSKLKGVLCALSVCVAISSVFIITQAGTSAASMIKSELSQINSTTMMLTTATDSRFTGEDMTLLDAEENVSAYMPYVLEYSNYFVKNQSFPTVICGITENLPKIFNLELYHGRMPLKSDITGKKNVAVVDDILAKKTYGRTNIVGKKIRLQANGSIAEYEIIGVISSQKGGVEAISGQNLPDLVYVPYTTINQSYGDTIVQSIAVNCFSQDTAQATLDSIVKKLSRYNTSRSLQVEKLGSYTDTAIQIADIVALLVSAIAGISVIVGGIGIMNAMVASVENRKSEIGTYIAIGARPGDIMVCFILESVIVSVIGGILGIVFSSTAILMANRVLGIGISISPISLVYCFIGAVICGGLFGYLPSKQAARLNPIDAIRWE